MRAVVVAAACHLCTLFISPAHRVALFYSFILFFSSFTTILYIFSPRGRSPRLYYNNCDSADPAPRIFSFSGRCLCTLFYFLRPPNDLSESLVCRIIHVVFAGFCPSSAARVLRRHDLTRCTGRSRKIRSIFVCLLNCRFVGVRFTLNNRLVFRKKKKNVKKTPPMYNKKIIVQYIHVFPCSYSKKSHTHALCNYY